MKKTHIKNKTNPLISVVIPTYNHANYLKKALESVLYQSYKNLELIIIDNYSTDNTHELIKLYDDPRIRYLKIKNHGVIAKSRNAGVIAAKGDWVAFLDSDDCWTLDKLKTCLVYLNDETDLLYHDLGIVTKKQTLLGKKSFKTRILNKPILIDLLINGNAIRNSSVIVRKKLLRKIGLIDESKKLIAAEDYNSWLKISILTDQFLYLPIKLGYIYLHDRNVSNKNMSIAIKNASKPFLKYLNQKQKIKHEANIRYLSGRYNYLNDNFNKSKKDFLFVISNSFFKLKLKALLMIVLIMLKQTKQKCF